MCFLSHIAVLKSKGILLVPAAKNRWDDAGGWSGSVSSTSDGSPPRAAGHTYCSHSNGFHKAFIGKKFT